MKTSIRAGVLALSILAPLVAAAETAWLAGLEDLPLMPGLIEKSESSLVFDKPGGRIVEADAIGRVAREAVERFYAETLPALGWTPSGSGSYRREGETLTLIFGRERGTLTVHFSIRPEAGR